MCVGLGMYFVKGLGCIVCRFEGCILSGLGDALCVGLEMYFARA